MPVSFGIVLVTVYGHRIVRIKAAVTACLLGLTLLAGAYMVYPTIQKRFAHSDSGSTSVRMPLNMAALSIVAKNPMLGIGLNNFAESFKREDETGNSRLFRGYQHVVHNLHLWILAEDPESWAWSVSWRRLLCRMFVAWRTAARAPPVERATLIGIAAGLLAHLIHGLVDPGFRISLSVSLLVFTSMGIVGAIASRHTGRRLR